MSEPDWCETCLNLDAAMKASETDAEWGELLARLENHRAEVHLGVVSKEQAEDEESDVE